jgi:murein L,D-transpeptidase YafK
MAALSPPSRTDPTITSRTRWRRHLMRMPWVVLFCASLAILSQAAEPQLPPQVAQEAPSANRISPSGSPLLIRIFKEESQLELWTQTSEHFQLLATYPICNWSGVLGPKQYEGDRQTPEGFYSIGPGQLILSGKHPRSLDIGFPNAFDRSLARTGSHILLHGGCRSIGCFAMTDAAMEQIYAVAERALLGGQNEIPVHIFPFRMTEANLQRYPQSPWHAFWTNLKQAHDMFELTRIAPVIRACAGNYRVNRDEVSARADASDDCAPPAPAIADASTRQTLTRRAALWARGARTPAHTRRTAIAPLPRDNVAECNRLWSRTTGISQANWKAICKELDFQRGRTSRTVHRAVRASRS